MTLPIELHRVPDESAEAHALCTLLATASRACWLQGQMNIQINSKVLPGLVLEGGVFKMQDGFKGKESLGVNRPLWPVVTACSGQSDFLA